MLHSSQVKDKYGLIPIAIQEQAFHCPITRAAVETFVNDGFRDIEHMLTELVLALYTRAKFLHGELVDLRMRESFPTSIDGNEAYS